MNKFTFLLLILLYIPTAYSIVICSNFNNLLNNIEGEPFDEHTCNEKLKTSIHLLPKKPDHNLQRQNWNLAQVIRNQTRNEIQKIVTSDFRLQGATQLNSAQGCSIDSINELYKKYNCNKEEVNKLTKLYFNENSIEELVANMFVNNTISGSVNSKSSENSCISNVESSIIIENIKTHDKFQELLGNLEFNCPLNENNSFEDSAINKQAETNPIEVLKQCEIDVEDFSSTNSVLGLASKSNSTKNELAKQLINFYKEKGSSPSYPEKNNFIKSLLSNSLIKKQYEEQLPNICEKLFSAPVSFLCQPPSQLGTSNHLFNDEFYNLKNSAAELATVTDTKDIIAYIGLCRSKVCSSNTTEYNSKAYCSQLKENKSFDINKYLNEIDNDIISQSRECLNTSKDICNSSNISLTKLNNTFKPNQRNRFDETLFSNLSLDNLSEQMCSNCTDKATCTTYCNTNTTAPLCSNDNYKVWLDIQDMKATYTQKYATPSTPGNPDGTNGAGAVGGNERSLSPFMKNFLGQIGADVMAGKTPTIGEPDPKNKVTLTQETLAAASNGTLHDTEEARERSQSYADAHRRREAGRNPNMRNAPAGFGKAPGSKNRNAARNNFSVASGNAGQVAMQAPSDDEFDRDKFIDQSYDLMRDLIGGSQEHEAAENAKLMDFLNTVASNESNIRSQKRPKRKPSSRRKGSSANNDYGSTISEQGTNGNQASIGMNGATNNFNQTEESEEVSSGGSKTVSAATPASSGVAGSAGIRGGSSGSSGGQGASGPTDVNVSFNELDKFDLKDLINSDGKNLPKDRPFILVIQRPGLPDVKIRVEPKQIGDTTVFAPIISESEVNQHDIYPYLQNAPLFKKYFEYSKSLMSKYRNIRI